MSARGLLILGVALAPGQAVAGMPIFYLSDLAELRLETLSFFLFVILLASFGLRWIWNGLRTDFERLPRLSYRGAVFAVLLWGLAMQLVLTMISGARELMTPGAWLRSEAVHELVRIAYTDREQLEFARRQQLSRLRAALWEHAEAHAGRFPADEYDAEFAESTWLAIDPAGSRYVYVGDADQTTPARPLAFEPESYGARRLVLLTTGEIESWPIAEIYSQLRQKLAP